MMIIIKEREIGNDPIIQLSLRLKIIDTRPRWYVFIKDEQIDWFDKYGEASGRLLKLKTLSKSILIQYFEHKECDGCDEVYKAGVKKYRYTTRKSDNFDEGTWTSVFCMECYIAHKEDKDVISIDEVSEE